MVLGGGPAGCAAAIALRRSGGGTVVVVEGGDYGAERIGESIPPDSRQLLARLGLIEAFLAQGHEPCYGSCSSWGTETLGFNDFAFNPNGAGFHLDRRRFDLLLARRAREVGAHVVTGTRFRSVRRRPSGGGAGEPLYTVEIEIHGAVRAVEASYVIDATGSAALAARQLGSRRLTHDRFFCVTGYFHLREGAELLRLTMLEAVREGWWYAARLPDQRIAVALACEGDDLRTGELYRPEPWLRRASLSTHLAPALLDSFFVPGSLRVCPVGCFVLDRPTGPNWLAVGDAASSLDPLSAQGIYKALSDGLEAARAILAGFAGDHEATGRYATEVRRAYDTSLGQREAFYAREHRWPGSTFWARRREPRLAAMRQSGKAERRVRQVGDGE